MTPIEQDLARQLAEHPKWEPMPGMLVLAGFHKTPARVTAINADGPVHVAAISRAGWLNPTYRGCVPDLADPATQGCLWAMLMETGRIVYASWAAHEGELTITWIESPRDHQHIGHADLRPMAYGEALARALLDVWGDHA